MRAQRREGYVLLAVLWILVGASASSLALTIVARRVVRRALNRRDEIAAEWIADGCIARAHAIIDGAFTSASGVRADTAPWADLDRVVERSSATLPSTCHVRLRPSGRTVDVNTADSGSLTRLFHAIGLSPARTDSAVMALLAARATMASAPAAVAQSLTESGRPPPDVAFSDVRELRDIRGLNGVGGLDSLIGVEADRIVLDRAPLAVVASLPGFGVEAVGRVAEYRLRGQAVPNLMQFSATLSPDARTELLAHYPDIVRATANEPDAWNLTSWARVPASRVTSVIDVRLARSGTGAAIVRRRMWVQ